MTGGYRKGFGQHTEKGRVVEREHGRAALDNPQAEPLKFCLRRLLQYFPWFLLLLGVDVFSCLLIWLSDMQAFLALTVTIFLATFLFFAAVCGAVLVREKEKENAFRDFLEKPDEYHEEVLRKAAGTGRESSVRLLGNVLRKKDSLRGDLQSRLAEYEEYVESWAHETKMPLSLLALLLDNRGEELPESVRFKLEYIENRMGEFIDQMLFYARVKGTRKDYLFELVRADSCVGEALADYRPLLEEKRFTVASLESAAYVYTDRRGFLFLLRQLVSNAVKYSAEEPKLEFGFQEGERSHILFVRDNGRGVRSCDLPYIFEKGFTGHSGEGRKEATGMGLYLAGEIAGDLGLKLEAVSEWGKGFEMRILFPVVEERRALLHNRELSRI